MMRKSPHALIIIFFFFCGLGYVGGCSLSRERLYFAAPNLLAHTDRAMKTAGFWISRHPSPDTVVMTAEEIQRFNLFIQNDLQLTQDIPQMPSVYSGGALRSQLEKTWDEFYQKGFYTEDGRKAQPRFYEEIKANLNLEAIPEQIPLQYGFIVHFADQKVFPLDQGLYAKSRDLEFDELQNSDLDVGTPLCILHTSRDGRWHWVISNISSGWVKAQNVALGSLGQIRSFVSSRFFVVIIKSKADIFLDSRLTQHYDYVRMGTGFPLAHKVNPTTIAIWFPWRSPEGKLVLKQGYMKAQDVHEGYLPYTPRHILEQAFELLNAPYGWGGMHGEQDCSRFLQEVFATVGINLPRNSVDQAKVGGLWAKFEDDPSPEEKLAILKKAVGGTTLLPLKGHIMLYLGMVDGRPYAIHAVWGYREAAGREDRVRVINRVAVTDLSLGEGSRKGSLLARLLAVVGVY